MRHHMLGKGAQAVEHLLLRHGLDRVEQEVDAIDAHRFPSLAGPQHAFRIANRDTLRHPRRVTGSAGLTAQRRQQAQRRIRLARIGFTRRDQLRREEVESAEQAAANLVARFGILMAEEEVRRADFVVDE